MREGDDSPGERSVCFTGGDVAPEAVLFTVNQTARHHVLDDAVPRVDSTGVLHANSGLQQRLKAHSDHVQVVHLGAVVG